MRQLFFSPILVLATTAIAQQDPRTEAGLFRHMTEVNAQWTNQFPDLPGGGDQVHFATEAERIATHLHLVASRLRMHAPASLLPAALNQRRMLLAELDAYADRGIFPENQVLPYRNPVFIDPHGTACAVGQLMIASGHRDLAERIDGEQELGYVAELLRSPALGPLISVWAADHGFTGDELAWIQPGYPPTTPWAALGGGTNGPVSVLLELPGGMLLAAGQFSEAGGTAVQNVALWDGSSFSALGTGISGTITCGTVLGSDVYLGGSSINGIHDLAHWNGTQWNYSTVFDGKLPQITALFGHEGALYAAGVSLGFAGAYHAVKLFSGNTWSPVGENLDQPVLALAWHDGQLVVGGAFTTTTGPSGTAVLHVATLAPGGWEQLGGGLDGQVNVLLNTNGMLYAGGTILLNVLPQFGLARLPSAGVLWEPLLPGSTGYIFGPGNHAEVRTLASAGTGLYVGGSFHLFQGTLIGQHLAYYSGTPDELVPVAWFDAPVHALASEIQTGQESVFAGGDFTATASDALPYLAGTTLITGVPPSQARQAGMSVWPNPATDVLTVALAGPVPAGDRLEVLDAMGRIVWTGTTTGTRTTIHVASLAAGSYAMRYSSGDRTVTQRFIRP